MVTDPRTDRPLQDVGILVFVQVEVREHKPTRFDRVIHDGEGASGIRPEILNTTPIPPSYTERTSPVFTTIVGMSMRFLRSRIHPPPISPVAVTHGLVRRGGER